MVRKIVLFIGNQIKTEMIFRNFAEHNIAKLKTKGIAHLFQNIHNTQVLNLRSKLSNMFLRNIWKIWLIKKTIKQ